MGNSNTSMRTPLKNVRRLGSAKEGADHFWKQRVTAVANLVLGLAGLGLIVTLAGHDHAVVRKALAHPFVALPILLFVISGIIHMKIGMQVIIEDYIKGEGAKIVALMLNMFFAILVGAACIFAVLKLSFVGA